MRHVVLIASMAAMLALAACATARPGAGDLPVSEYTGHFTGDASWFRPCAGAAGDTLWWTTFMGTAVGQWEQLKVAGRVKPDEQSYLRVRAGLSERRTAGADGRGSRYLYVHDVLEVRPARPGDCDSSGAPKPPAVGVVPPASDVPQASAGRAERRLAARF